MYDCAVIGAGPGGYPAAIRCAQLGLKTVLIEREWLGGVCMNAGCIPSKALIHAGKTFIHARDGGAMGIAGNISLDVAKMQEWKRSIVKRLTDGVAYLCHKNGVEVIEGDARFVSPTKLAIRSLGPERHIDAKNVIVATGSSPIQIPGFEFDGTRVITPTEALDLDPLPKSMAIIGGGVSGMELGMLYARLGVKVSVIEIMEEILPGFDPDLARAISRAARKAGMDIHTSTKARSVRGENVIAVRSDGSEVAVPGEKIFVVVGRIPNTMGLGLDAAGVKVEERGFVPVDEHCRTNVSHVYAIGDITGLPMLAHKATREGLIAAETIAGHASCARTECPIPGVVFTEPELVAVGMTEPEARQKGIAYVSGRFPFSALGRSLAAGSSEGFVKVLAEVESHRVIGLHIAGAGVSDLAGECTLAILKKCTLEEVASTIHAHPTYGEAIVEACEVALGRAIHVLNSK